MGRRKDLSSSATVEAAKRGEGDTSYCLVRAPRVDSLGGFSHATRVVARARESARPRVGVADACAATRPGSRPQAPAHARAIASPPGCVLVPRGSRATGALPAPPNARAGPKKVFGSPTRRPTRAIRRKTSRVSSVSPATRTRRDPPTAFAMTTARAPRLARPERTKRLYA